MGFHLPWKKKKSQLEDRDRERGKPEPAPAAAVKQGSDRSLGSQSEVKPKVEADKPPAEVILEDSILTPAYRGDADRVKELLQGYPGKVDVHACDALGNTALHLAAFNGHLDVMKVLIEEGGADPNKMNGEKDTALYMAVLSNDLECVKYIASKDIQFNCTNIEGFAPLHYAAGEGNLEIVRYLTEECGAETEIPDNLGLTPGFCAVLQGRLEVAEYLLQQNRAGVMARNMSSDTMLHCALKACAPKALIKVLLDHGADLEAVGADNLSCEKMLNVRGHNDLISSAKASRASTPAAPSTPAAHTSASKGPAQIPWMKKYISAYIDSTGRGVPNKPYIGDAGSTLHQEWEFSR